MAMFPYYCSIRWTEGFRIELVSHCLFSGQQKCGHVPLLLFHKVDGRGLDGISVTLFIFLTANMFSPSIILVPLGGRKGFRMELVPHCLFPGQQKCSYLHLLLFHKVDRRGLGWN